MATDIVQNLSREVFDSQNATALLTGIVAETERYSNDKATPHTMSVAGVLMSVGASTQLVSNELDNALKAQTLPPVVDKKTSDEPDDGSDDIGELDIDHSNDAKKTPDDEAPIDSKDPKIQDKTKETDEEDEDELLGSLNLTDSSGSSQPEQTDSKPADKNGDQQPAAEPPEETAEQLNPDEEADAVSQSKQTKNRMIKEPPHFTGQLTANSEPEEQHYAGSSDPLSNPPNSSALYEKSSKNQVQTQPAQDEDSDIDDSTLAEIEQSVASSHLQGKPPIDNTEESIEPKSVGEVAQLSVDEARKAAQSAAAAEDSRPQARADVQAVKLGQDLNNSEDSSSDSNGEENSSNNQETQTSNSSLGPPPPVPPPITPPS